GPGADLPQGTVGDADGIVVHAEDERGDGVDIAFGEAFEDGGVFARLVESLVDVFEIGEIDGLHADEDPLASGSGDQVAEFLVAQEVGADLSDPVNLGVSGDDVTKKRFGALHVDGEIVVDEEDGHLAFFFAGASFQEQQFVHYALVGAEADGVAEKSGHGAELAAVGAAASGLNRNDAECSPAFTDFPEQRVNDLGQEIELVEIDLVPGNHGILLQRRLALLAKNIDGRINFFEFAANGVTDDPGPSFV